MSDSKSSFDTNAILREIRFSMSNFDANAILRGAQLTVVGGMWRLSPWNIGSANDIEQRFGPYRIQVSSSTSITDKPRLLSVPELL